MKSEVAAARLRSAADLVVVGLQTVDSWSYGRSLSPSSFFLFARVCVCRCRGWATGASAFECQRKPQRYNLDKRLLFKYVRCCPRRVPFSAYLPPSLTHTHTHLLSSSYVISWSGQAPLLSDRQRV